MQLSLGWSARLSPHTTSHERHIHQACPSVSWTSSMRPLSSIRTSNDVMRKPLLRKLEARATQTESTEMLLNSTRTNTALTQRSKDYFQGDSRPIILYDGVCNLCNGAVSLMLDLDPEGKHFRLAALQSPAGKTLLQRCGRSPDDISSIVLVEPNYRGHIRSDAILKIAAGLRQPPLPLLALLGFPVPPAIRDAVYDQVANNRYSIFGRTDSCRLTNAGQEHRFVVD
ncbi:hypothetical protein DUNSADRAFT_3868 [Dunaliella salina]|uniref:Thiol-disulfide oxidoreductase DCC n=1 Tax=Dunaliella salina TaxID=3046 RepID=A0ABQ7GT63_DUNSA|nr:hypothetical protein DUNSADRAFT_3868 [Dunaliella salina]|eukprot:KAF5837796.1 hypothetical protein DUNSADRAFT_3868 [Dunaliella salina]